MRRLSVLLAGLICSSIGLCDVPTVAMTYPPANATIAEALSPTILLEATASDADEAVSAVYFYVCPAAGLSCDSTATMAGVVQASPYRLPWTPPHAAASGSLSIRYLVWATAVNAVGQSKISATVPITLLQPAPAPTIKLIAPSAPIGFAVPAAPVLYATAAPATTVPPSSIARVDFLDGQDVIATLTKPNSVPEGYAYTWSNAAPGPHQISARVTDTLGDTANAPPVTVYIFPADQAPQVTLTSPVSGQTFNRASTISLAATATSAARSIQRVEFVAGSNAVATAFAPPYAANWVGPPPGNYAIVARAFDDLGVAAASAAAYVEVTESPRPPAVVMTSPAPGSTVIGNGAVPLAAAALSPDGVIGRVDFYAGTKLLGSSATAPYVFNWTTPGTGAVSLTAKAYDLRGQSASSTALAVTVSSKVPSVSLTSPAAGTRLTAPATIDLSASASEPGSSVGTVEFYANGTPIASLASPPYNAVWSNVAAGTYSLTAKATDSAGASKTSATVAITVVNNALPSVAITAPTSGQTIFVGQPITLAATASDSDGTVSKVEFLADGLTIGAVGSPPFTQVWMPSSAGSHAIQARATDNLGAVSTSSPVTVTVGPNSIPTASITAPISGQAFAVGPPVTITATASDPDGRVTKLEFIADGAVIGSVAALPFTWTWSGASIGAHVLAVRATDNAGAVAFSAPVAITIASGTLPTVSLVSPIAGDAFSAGSSIALAATAASANGAIARVDFYAGGTTLIGSVTTPPFVLAWTGAVPGTYAVAAKATDSHGAMATSPSVSIQVVTPTLAITSPGPNAAVAADFVLVSGTYQAPTNSGITINGAVASNDGQGHFTANNVPLAAGANTLTIQLATPDGQMVTQTLQITSSAAAPIQLYADPDADFAPATFAIRLKNRTPNAIVSFTYSNLGGGQMDMSASNQDVLALLTYPTSGLYRPAFTLVDSLGNRYTQTIALLVRDRSTLDQTLQRTWLTFKNSLAVRNKAAAMQALTASAQSQYSQVFDTLLPYLPNVVSTWSVLQASASDLVSAEYGINKTIDGVNRIFLIEFVLDADGVWRLDSM